MELLSISWMSVLREEWQHCTIVFAWYPPSLPGSGSLIIGSLHCPLRWLFKWEKKKNSKLKIHFFFTIEIQCHEQESATMNNSMSGLENLVFLGRHDEVKPGTSPPSQLPPRFQYIKEEGPSGCICPNPEKKPNHNHRRWLNILAKSPHV